MRYQGSEKIRQSQNSNPFASFECSVISLHRNEYYVSFLSFHRVNLSPHDSLTPYHHHHCVQKPGFNIYFKIKYNHDSHTKLLF